VTAPQAPPSHHDTGTSKPSGCWSADIRLAPRPPDPGHPAPLGGVERPRRVVRFARLIHWPVRVLGGPAVRAACGGNLKRT
jgi:hypothetical protein